MMTKKIIIFSLATIILLVAVAVFIVNKNKPAKNNDFLNNVQSSLQCAKEGERFDGGLKNPCCSGLKAIGGWPGGYEGDCTLPPPPTGLGVCAKCGDGKCDINNGENKCNCKEDCK